MRLLSIILSALLATGVCFAQQADSAQPQINNATETASNASADATANTSASLSAEDLWNSANAAYNEGNFEKAATEYEQILLQNLHSAALYYNLANAYFKQGELGKALLNYNRASRIAPSDEDIRHNQEYAEKMTKDSIEKLPEFFLSTWLRQVRGAMSCTAWTILSLVMLVVALTMGLVYLLSQRMSLRKMGFYTMWTALPSPAASRHSCGICRILSAG